MANPAKTLLGHFQKITAMQSQSWPQAWETATGIAWERACGPLLGLLDKTEAILQARPDLDLDSLLLFEPEWRRAIVLNGVNMTNGINSSGFQLSKAGVAGLSTVSIVIDGFAGLAKNPDTEALARVSDAVDDLRAAVCSADDLEADLRAFLLEKVNDMRRRLDQVQVAGYGPAQSIPAEIIGSGAVESSYWRRAARSSVSQKLAALLLALNILNAASPAIETTRHATETAVTFIEQVFEGQKQLLPGPDEPPQLTSGSTNDDAASDVGTT